MTPDEMFDKMAAVVSAPNYPLLRHHRRDFEVHDKEFLANAWSPESKMLWIVRESGTTLIALGVCKEVSDWGRAAIDAGGDMEFHLAEQRGLSRIAKNKALEELSAYQWSNRSGRLVKGERAIAEVADIHVRRVDNRLWTETALSSVAKPEALTLGEAIGLLQMAELAAINKAGTFFCQAKSVLLDGQDLHALVGAKRKAWLSEAKGKEKPSQARGKPAVRARPQEGLGLV